jgi:tetratricopeptide (TPR) repeat protein
MSGAPNAKVNADSRSATGGWPVLAVAAVLILAALGAYWNSWEVPFLLDDSGAIADNPSIRHLGRIGDVLAPPPTVPASARPLLNLSFALNYAGGGLSVRGYHAVNLLVHICAGLALLGIVRRTLLLPGLRSRYGEVALPLAAFAALLWTLHPLQTEAVTYISQRAESLMGLFYLLTLYGFVRAVTAESRNCWLILSVVACLCGMATKQVMVTAPVLMLLYDRAFVSGSFRSALANRRWYYASLAATWVFLGFLMHRSSLAPLSVGFGAGVGWVTYALTELRVVADYLKLAFWPHPLVFDYGSEILVTDPLAMAPYALIVVAILAGAAITWRKSPLAGFLGAWFFLILAPTSTVVPIAEQPMAESRMYLPLAAVVVLVTLVSYALGRRRAFVALGLVAVGLGVLTVRRNCDYRSELSIWEDTVTQEPQASRGQNNLANALANIPGRLPAAIVHYEEALRFKPTYAEAHNNLANALAKIPGRMPEAVGHYEEALRLKPDFAEVHYNLAIAFAEIPGRVPDAIVHYGEALRLSPDNAEAHTNLALALAATPGRMPEAMAHFGEALRLKPDFAAAHYNFAVVLAKMPGRMPEAIAHYEAALRFKPDLAEAHNNLGIALAQMPGRISEAVAHFEEAVHLQPGFVEARNNLASLYAETGRWAAAIDQLEIAARLDPASTAIRHNLEKLKSRRPP